MRFRKGLISLGVSERYFNSKLNDLLTKKDAVLLRRAGKIRTPQMTLQMRRSIMDLSRRYPDLADRITYWREATKDFGRFIDVNEKD